MENKCEILETLKLYPCFIVPTLIIVAIDMLGVILGSSFGAVFGVVLLITVVVVIVVAVSLKKGKLKRRKYIPQCNNIHFV